MKTKPDGTPSIDYTYLQTMLAAGILANRDMTDILAQSPKGIDVGVAEVSAKILEAIINSPVTTQNNNDNIDS